VLSRVIIGARVSLLVGVLAMVVSALVGLVGRCRAGLGVILDGDREQPGGRSIARPARPPVEAIGGLT
jgi:hypothetical protein